MAAERDAALGAAMARARLWAAQALLDEPNPDLPRLDGTPVSLTLGRHVFTLSLQDTDKLADVNTTRPDDLVAYLSAADPEAGAVLAARIVAGRPHASVAGALVGMEAGLALDLAALVTAGFGGRKVEVD
ncbi:MAG: hypothetical protein AAGE76_07250 [Pseudomonadota bacterium]